MRELVDRLNDEDAAGGSPWVPAAMAHLNFAMIHPFKDGNGCTARTLQALVVSRARIQSDSFLSIEKYLGANTPAHDAVLTKVGEGTWTPTNDARPWVRFSLKAQYAQARIIERRIAESARLWEAIDEARQSDGLHERVMATLYTAAWGFKCTEAHTSPTRRASPSAQRPATCNDSPKPTRSSRSGKRRGRYYLASDRLKALRDKTRGPHTLTIDLFE